METKFLLSCSQKPVTGPYPEPKNQSRPEALWKISQYITFLRELVKVMALCFPEFSRS
jgi:hypothetical protein